MLRAVSQGSGGGSGPTTNPVSIAQGGTNATDAATARANLGVVAAPASSTDGLTYVVRNGVMKPYFIFPGYVANTWCQPDYSLVAATGTATTANIIYFSPFVIYEKVTISTLQLTTSATGTNAGMAIYPMDPTTKRPLVNAAPLAQTATFAIATATNYQVALASAVTLDPGLYWVAHNTDAAATIQCQSTTQTWAMSYTGASTGAIAASAANAGKYHFELAQTFGSWPTTGTPTEIANTTHAAIICFMPSVVFS